MKRSDQDRLLREVLADESLARLRRDSLASGLASLRARKRWRSLLAVAASLMVMLAVFFVARRESLSPRISTVAETSIPHVNLIDDEQLFALFPDRPAALIGPPGAQKLIFLDALAASPGPGEK